jgi:serine O-acetyltransferase
VGKRADKDIRALVGAMLESYRETPETIKISASNKVNKDVIIESIEQLRHLLFPGFFGDKHLKSDSVEYHVGELLETLIYHLQKQIARALPNRKEPVADPGAEAEAVTYVFLERLPHIRRLLATDVAAFYEGDPAAFSTDEIVWSYPGLYAIMVSRLAHELHLLDVPLIPRMMTEHAHSLTGIDIHPGATIGHHFFVDHGTGIVVGETTVIGNHVKIYQGVTLGALSTRGGQILRGVKRHPTIEDNVTIYSGASILGGQTVIGEGVVIGSNAFITASVQEKTKVSVKSPELRFKTDRPAQNPAAAAEDNWDFVI